MYCRGKLITHLCRELFSQKQQRYSNAKQNLWQTRNRLIVFYDLFIWSVVNICIVLLEEEWGNAWEIYRKVNPVCVPWRLETVNQSTPPSLTNKHEKKTALGSVFFLLPVWSNRKASTSASLPRYTFPTGPSPAFSPVEPPVTVEPRCCSACGPYRWIRLPFSGVWRLEAGSTRCEGGLGESLDCVLLVPHRPQAGVYTCTHSD